MKPSFMMTIRSPRVMASVWSWVTYINVVLIFCRSLFDAQLKNEGGKYSVSVGGCTVELSEEKQANLTAHLVVGHVHKCRVDLLPELDDLRPHLVTELGVQVGEGFVHEEHFPLRRSRRT